MVSQIKMKDPTSSQILQPTNACQSHPTQNINAKCSILQQNMQGHINKSYFLTS